MIPDSNNDVIMNQAKMQEVQIILSSRTKKTTVCSWSAGLLVFR